MSLHAWAAFALLAVVILAWCGVLLWSFAEYRGWCLGFSQSQGISRKFAAEREDRILELAREVDRLRAENEHKRLTIESAWDERDDIAARAKADALRSVIGHIETQLEPTAEDGE